ncbi:dihydrofolate reductase [candidate division WS5 bacterium]|uniref:Dihydrofolate reductase n=1 Tax=candidate division WS5 bacterium TaxID=2093353 RepID=A0A419DEI0_9BACT|nr:MAG: dihydrofolate reductase [candidate division WS5 bacterium]
MKTAVMMVMSADGLIAKDANHPVSWSSKEDKEFFLNETKEAGVVIYGRNTLETLKKPLPGRLNIVLTYEPEKDSKLFTFDNLEFTKDSPGEILESLKRRGYNKAIIGGGSMVNSLFLKNKLVNELIVTVEPKIFGKGMTIFNGPDCSLDAELKEVKKINNNSLILRYKLLWP